ncbi:hypothetical protein Varpa_2713 [Variovorax paradoxus EPS]|uniref:Uncharacterized protein n=1 Tax=Variovorax paradoxus (strain EPS) TaxID=595537 RepID=E6V2U1_VARPE|nr:hypothetical protein Varpa_2713 [Variovorax paradoxus EPS]
MTGPAALLDEANCEPVPALLPHEMVWNLTEP